MPSHPYYIFPLVFASLAHGLLPRDACTALESGLRLENTTIISASHVSGPINVTSMGICEPNSQVLVSSAICRVEFVINTTSTSAVYAEAWLPDTWYGRYSTVGNSGLDVSIDHGNLDYGASLHFATIGSNNGHDGTVLDGRPFLNKPEVINDFAFRAIHVQTVIGKQIVEAYYGSPHQKSYFLGCSTGGRQGTQAALKYPEDFDGIVAGAVPADWNHLVGLGTMLARYVGAPYASASPSFISSALWDVVATEVLKQCDELDGVKDEIITEPDACNFRPEALLCNGDNTTACLSNVQVETLRKIYQPLYGIEGQLLFPRPDPGFEASPDSQSILNGTIYPIAGDWFRYTIFNDSSYDFSNFSLKDIALADSINPGGISTFDGDFSKFRDRGGKFLTYHGRRDWLIPSGNSKRLYNLISRTLGMPSLDSFYRLFLIPGMDHCHNGPGAGIFGQMTIASNVVNASTHNVLLAMVDWVEGGVPPDNVVGLSLDGQQRTHCRYPQTSVWSGEMWICQDAGA
ncbi:putative feruloyl esterase B-2 [Termitomyces sp. J132]|nr:hypothetical protein H2248_008056 [Termitomyces sp. 'cryptogamus']KNZ75807.1 putative feruloyl esterase B-2 [Termitomyces sp. J132]